MRFLRHGGIFLVRWGFKTKNKKSKPNPGTGANRLPLVGPRAQVKERAGRIALFLIVRR